MANPTEMLNDEKPRISIRPRGVHVPRALDGYVRRRLTSVVAGVGRRVNSLAVHIKDLNGPRGGVDKVCVITAELGSGQVLVTEQRNEGLIASVDGAIRKLKRALASAVQGARRRSRRRNESVRTALCPID